MEASLTQIFEYDRFSSDLGEKSCKVKCKVPTCKHHFRKVVCKFIGTCKCGVKQEVVPPITHHKIEKQTVYDAMAKIHETLLNLAEKYAQESDLRLVTNAVAAVRDYLNPNQCYEDYLRETYVLQRKIAKRKTVELKNVAWCGKRQTFGRPMMKDKWEGHVRTTGIGAPSFWSGKRTLFTDEEESDIYVGKRTDESEEESGGFDPQDWEVYIGEIPKGIDREKLVEIIGNGMVRFQDDEFINLGKRTSFDEVDIWKPMVEYWFERDFVRNKEGETKFCHLVEDGQEDQLYTDFDRFFDQVRQYLSLLRK